MPSSGSLTTDQWLLLATVYGPVIIPQLWSTCLPMNADNDILHHRVNAIKKAESEKQAQASSKANQKKALAAVKIQGKDTYEAKKARIAQEKLAIAEAKTQEKLRIVAARQAGKVRLAAEKKRMLPQRGLQKNARQLCKQLKICLKDKYDRLPLLQGTYTSLWIWCTQTKPPLCDSCWHLHAQFGPLHDFWMFLFERLNKVLKSFKSNNHAHDIYIAKFSKQDTAK
ncbi:uncharacterized protein EDB91DRAFT_1086435 [Suillus paluster]|uniref:uncharacterized protein n=1 Tax=Suillus paluster TaxID=48578 RepID=UPI001B8700B2|nr:uncharacterized protein EDB91DRAFT_1086435 [Suillus paluster]KAG1727357.1 hypothetical protein EDB91DRAFT_1086435 [Suillus paluster]